MRVLIAAQAVRMGGALQHLRGLLPALVEVGPRHDWLLVTNAETARSLPPLPKQVSLETHSTERLDPVRRWMAEYRLLSSTARAFGADVLLAFNSFALPGLGCPQALIAANALYLCPEYWRRVRLQGIVGQADARLRAGLFAWSLRRAAAVIAPSRWMAQALCQRFRLPAQHVHVVPHGVAPVFFEGGPAQPSGERPTESLLVAVSKHGINKDFPTLVRAVAALRRHKLPRVRLTLTGTASESPFARATASLIAELGLDHAVTFAGELSPPDLARLLRSADLFVFPSWCESFGLPQLEAAAAGLPIIAPDLAVSRELLDDAARYYTPLDPMSLANQIESLLHDAADRARLGAAATERARAFTWSRAATATLVALEAATASPPAQAHAAAHPGERSDAPSASPPGRGRPKAG